MDNPFNLYHTCIYVTVSKVAKNVSRICEDPHPVECYTNVRCAMVEFRNAQQLGEGLCALKRFEVFASSVYEFCTTKPTTFPAHDVLLWVNACAAMVNEAALEARLLFCTTPARGYNYPVRKRAFDELVRWIVSYKMDICRCLHSLGMPVLLITPNNIELIEPTKLGRTSTFEFIPVCETALHIKESVGSWSNLLSQMVGSQDCGRLLWLLEPE